MGFWVGRQESYWRIRLNRWPKRFMNRFIVPDIRDIRKMNVTDLNICTLIILLLFNLIARKIKTRTFTIP
jgi:hypothetical protein